ncbi:MAG TPA: hypothetical protein VM866_10515 [Pyrinomonadaceae bacterium]|jgi:hypothetical protein|nr:hypothetical protein [Pyrinomonadaceae bacterium]
MSETIFHGGAQSRLDYGRHGRAETDFKVRFNEATSEKAREIREMLEPVSASIRTEVASVRSGVASLAMKKNRPNWSEVLSLDVISFLRYYCRLRLDVVRGSHKTQRPLGIRYRWQDWRYREHLKRVENKAWGS